MQTSRHALSEPSAYRPLDTNFVLRLQHVEGCLFRSLTESLVGTLNRKKEALHIGNTDSHMAVWEAANSMGMEVSHSAEEDKGRPTSALKARSHTRRLRVRPLNDCFKETGNLRSI